MNPNNIQYNFSHYKGSSQIIPQEAGKGCTLASYGNLPLNFGFESTGSKHVCGFVFFKSHVAYM